MKCGSRVRQQVDGQQIGQVVYRYGVITDFNSIGGALAGVQWDSCGQEFGTEDYTGHEYVSIRNLEVWTGVRTYTVFGTERTVQVCSRCGHESGVGDPPHENTEPCKEERRGLRRALVSFVVERWIQEGWTLTRIRRRLRALGIDPKAL